MRYIHIPFGVKRCSDYIQSHVALSCLDISNIEPCRPTSEQTPWCSHNWKSPETIFRLSHFQTNDPSPSGDTFPQLSASTNCVEPYGPTMMGQNFQKVVLFHVQCFWWVFSPWALGSRSFVLKLFLVGGCCPTDSRLLLGASIPLASLVGRLRCLSNDSYWRPNKLLDALTTTSGFLGEFLGIRMRFLTFWSFLDLRKHTLSNNSVEHNTLGRCKHNFHIWDSFSFHLC